MQSLQSLENGGVSPGVTLAFYHASDVNTHPRWSEGSQCLRSRTQDCKHKIWGIFLKCNPSTIICDNISSKHENLPHRPHIFPFSVPKDWHFQSSSSSTGYEWLNETKGKYVVSIDLKSQEKPSSKSTHFLRLIQTDWLWRLMERDFCVCAGVYTC